MYKSKWEAALTVIKRLQISPRRSLLGSTAIMDVILFSTWNEIHFTYLIALEIVAEVTQQRQTIVECLESKRRHAK